MVNPGDIQMATYDDQNIFAKILRGELPCLKVYENDRTFAFLDIMPRSPGHTLVIPRAGARNLLDIREEDFMEVARTTRIIARMHIMPVKEGVALLPPQTRKEDPKVLEDHAAKLIAALKA